MSGCFKCWIDHCYDCQFKDGDPGWADADGVYEVSCCCCGRRTWSVQTLDAEYAASAEELRRRGWSQPTDPDQQPEEGSGR